VHAHKVWIQNRKHSSSLCSHFSVLLRVLSSVLFAPDNNNNQPTRPKLQSDITPNLAHAGR
jgi:hypothetical protein